jgi:hypothetical protein
MGDIVPSHKNTLGFKYVFVTWYNIIKLVTKPQILLSFFFTRSLPQVEMK